MPLSRAEKFRERADAALLAAIEIYNKPSFAYREESFAILALNAWELLLKSRLLQLHGNNISCLQVYEPRRLKSGRWSSKLYVRRNRSGNVYTVSIQEAISKLASIGKPVPSPVLANIVAMTEIRDNSVHNISSNPELAQTVLEVGTATVRNFAEIERQWYGDTLRKYTIHLMPIGVLDIPAHGIAMSSDEERLLSYLRDIANTAMDDASEFSVAIRVEVSLHRSSDGAFRIGTTSDPKAPTIQLSEEDIRQQYPWDYAELVRRLKNRYVDFKANQRFHAARTPLMGDTRFVRTRYLDPGNPRSTRKDFYNPNIVTQFDTTYVRRP